MENAHTERKPRIQAFEYTLFHNEKSLEEDTKAGLVFHSERNFEEYDPHNAADAVGEFVISNGDGIRAIPAHLRELGNEPLDLKEVVGYNASRASLEEDNEEATESALIVRCDAITFSDHPLFSKEDHYVSAIKVLYRQYHKLLKAEMPQHYIKKIKANLDGFEDLRIGEESKGGEDETNLASNICSDICDDLSQHVSTMEKVWSLSTSIATHWSELKSLRVENKYRSTKLDMSYCKSNEESKGIKAPLLISSQLVLRVQRAIVKVEENENFNEKLNKAQDLLANIEEIRDIVGESQNIIWILKEDSATTPESQIPRTEIKRRQAIRKCNYNFELVVDGQVVTKTSKRPLGWPSFKVDFDYPIGVHLSVFPESVELQVIQSGWLMDSTLAIVPIAIPGQDFVGKEVNISALAPQRATSEFSASKEIANGLFEHSQTRFPSGNILSSIWWECSNKKEPCMLPGKPKIGTQLGPKKWSGRLVGEKYVPTPPPEADFIDMPFRLRDPAIDFAFPNLWDVKPFRRHRLLKLRSVKESLTNLTVPLTEEEITGNPSLMEVLAIGTDDWAPDYTMSYKDSQVRNFRRMIQEKQRNMGRRRLLPHISSLVKFSVSLPDLRGLLDWSFLKKWFAPTRRLKPKPISRTSTTVSQFDPSELKLFVQVVRGQNIPIRSEAIQQKQRQASSSSSFDHQSSAEGGFNNNMNNNNNNNTYNNNNNRSRPAFRSQSRSQSHDISEYEYDKVETKERVMSFLTLNFQEQHERTSSQEGPAPQWNEGVWLKLQLPHNDISPAALQSCQDDVHINLFDELVDRKMVDDRDPDDHLVKAQRRYLGSLAVPFSTIYMNGRIEGLFKVNTPPIPLGYSTEKKRPSSHSNGNASNDSYVHLLLTIDPPMRMPEEQELPKQSAEPLSLYKHIKRWYKRNIRSRSGNLRILQPLGATFAGEYHLITRFIKPLCPPPGLPIQSKTPPTSFLLEDDHYEPVMTRPEMLARFVSLIPFIEDWNAFGGDLDLWCTSQEFLDLLAGDWEEHAILLCNYFLWIDKDNADFSSAIVLGTGVPEGQTVYALRYNKATAQGTLYNACSGESYDVRSKQCPLTNVSMIATETNLFANIQREEIPHKMSWILDDATCWNPLFSGASPLLRSLQPANGLLRYTPTPAENVKDIQSDIYETLKLNIRQWRSHRQATRFNGSISETLRDILWNLEADKAQGKVARPEFEEQLLRTLDNYEVFGFPLNQTFTEVSAIVDQVKNTEIHLNNNPQIQFAVSVLVVPYPNNVLSVWVYVASLLQKPRSY